MTDVVGGSPHVFEITARGRLDARWSDWFDGFEIACSVAGDGPPITTLTGAVEDQAALRGILWRLWDLNLELISVVPRDA
jgi:hypothetical protein